MANAKSNIYPIALQNAELNLNKYDAEIRQYTGFNKNNAPFVGGCLSNIFTKDEVIEGGNKNNTYIDTNGDVYEVNTEGLFQNGNKVISFPSSVKFYQKRKILDNQYITKLYSDKIYIDIIGDSYYAHWGDGFSTRIGVIASEEKSHLNIAYKDGCIVFTYKRYRYSASLYSFQYIIIVPDDTKEYSLRDAPPNEYDTTNYGFPIPYGSEGVLTITHPIGCYITGNRSNGFGIFTAINEDNASKGIISVARKDGVNYWETYEQDGETYARLVKTFTDFNNNISNANFINTNACAYYMTNDGIFHFVHLPYRLDTSFTLDTYTFPSIAAGTNYSLVLNFKMVYNSTTQKGEVSEIITTATFHSFTGSDIGGKTIRNTNYSYYRDENNYINPYAVFYSLPLVDMSDEDNKMIISYSDYFHNYVLLENYKVDGGCCFFGDFKILINNGNLSNISIADFKIETSLGGRVPYNESGGSLHGAIIEDWNVIEDFVISSDGSKLIYKIGRTFYEVERTNVPELSLKYNQLVINCNHEQNSFDLSRQEILHFASDWNCSYLGNGYNLGYYITFGNYPDTQLGWLGSAINEYDLLKNPSLIINAKLVRSSYTILGYIRYCQTMLRYDKNCAIDVFYSPGVLEVTAPEYMTSLSVGPSMNPKLVGLPFPNNTDGNVQYNPCLFSEFFSSFGTDVFVKINNNTYQLMKSGQDNVMAYFLGTLIEGLENVFILQGQYYGIVNKQIFAIQFSGGVVSSLSSVVSIQGLQFCGNTTYEALFYSETNRCLYSFTGANILNVKQLVDKIEVVKSYKYNPATQSIFLLTDIGVLVSSLFGVYMINMPEAENIFLLNNGIVLCDNEGHYKYIRYYNKDDDFLKQNIILETMFYGMNDQTVTINDCLYIRLYSEEHEEGEIEISATTLSLQGRKTEKTTFKFKASDWDKMTHTIYMRYQPKEQRGLGISFRINSPFKIASLSVGSKPDAILVDKVSKGAINAPFNNTSSTIEW